MSRLHHSRVAAVGSEQDMLRLARVMLENGNWLEEDELGPRETLASRLNEIRKRAVWEAGEEAEFLPQMVAVDHFAGDSFERSRFEVAQQPSGLFTALFAFDSRESFQTEDWLRLHEKCGKVPMFAIHADEDFARDKGGVNFLNGQTVEDWDKMAETFLYLTEQYECGRPPEEAVQRLKKLAPVLSQEWDETVPEVLRGCMVSLAAARQGGELIAPEAVSSARERKDWPLLFELQRAQAEYVLWDAPRYAKYIAALESTLKEWQAEA